MKNLILLALLFLLPADVWAYANFIGHGYQSCMNCHFNPLGGGQLNDYGRAVSATLISSRMFYPKTWSEEKIADTSGFLFRNPKQDWLRLQANYRGFSLVTNPGSAKNENKQWITMQRDFRVALKFGENDKLVVVADIGKDPPPQQSIPGIGDDRTRSRNHYIGYRFTKKIGVYAGLMEKAYGLRVVEHNLFSRTVPQLDTYDQTHGVMGHYLDESWEGALHAYVGNLTTDADLRQKGASAFFEKTVGGQHRLGASFLTQKNNYTGLTSAAIHGRLNIKDGSAVLAELGQTKKTTDNNLDEGTSRYGLLQTVVRPWRGLYFLANIDYLKQDIDQSGSTARYGPALQWFPIQRIELRADIYDTRTFSPSTASRDSWSYLLQTHIWL
jgi:hypothetical protein